MRILLTYMTAQLTLERKIVWGFLVAFLLVLIASIISLRSTRLYIASAQWTEHTQKVLTRLSQMRSTMTDIETGMRGFVITGDDVFLETYREGMLVIWEEYNALFELLSDNPKQQQSLAKIKPLIEARLKNAKSVINLRKDPGFEAARELITSKRGKNIHDQIRLEVSVMEQVEERLFATRTQKANDSATYNYRLVSFSGMLTIMMIITALIFIRQDLKKRLVMEKHLEERNRELQVATEKALAADNIKSAFLATMSHELRTPLNSIIGFTGIILKEMAGPLNTEQKKQLFMVKDSAKHLLSLINDVLDISKIQAGQFEVHRETFSITESVDKVTGMIQEAAQKKGLQLKLDGDAGRVEMRSDQRRFEQILLNLLQNAVKFTEEGQIIVKTEFASGHALANATTHARTVKISVTDSGIGIKPGDLEKIFQAFRQIDSKLSRIHEGSGLGLAISSRLAELMGGEIRVESAWGKGSTFTVILPLTI